MELENSTAEEQTTNEVEVKQESAMPSVEELATRIDQLQATNERLLNESKTHKSKWQTLNAEREEQERVRLRESGDKEAYIGSLEQKLKATEETMHSLKHHYTAKDLKYEVGKLASDAHDIDDVITSLGGFEITPDGDGGFTGLKEAVEQVREGKKYLFKTNLEPTMVNKVPSGKMVTAPKKSISEMSRSEKRNILSSNLANIIK